MAITSAPRGALLPLHIAGNLTIPLVVGSATWIVAATFGMELGARRAVAFRCSTARPSGPSRSPTSSHGYQATLLRAEMLPATSRVRMTK